MKIKTSELTGVALDWAVATCEGWQEWDAEDSWELAGFFAKDGDFSSVLFLHTYSPSTNWAQGGPIIEREDISFRKYHNPSLPGHGTYYAKVCQESGSLVNWSKRRDYTGTTALEASMRCYVASSLGEEIEIPDELGAQQCLKNSNY